MKLTVLGSGSTGNAVLIVAGETRVLIDAGLSARELMRRLALVGEDASRLDGIVVTHEHGDHVGGLRVLLKLRESIARSTCPAKLARRTSASILASAAKSRGAVRRR